MTHLGITSVADVLSRLTKIPAIEKCHFDDEHVRLVTLEAVPVTLSLKIQGKCHKALQHLLCRVRH